MEGLIVGENHLVRCEGKLDFRISIYICNKGILLYSHLVKKWIMYNPTNPTCTWKGSMSVKIIQKDVRGS